MMEKSPSAAFPAAPQVALTLLESQPEALDRSPGKVSLTSETTKAPSFADTPHSLPLSASSGEMSTRSGLPMRDDLFSP